MGRGVWGEGLREEYERRRMRGSSYERTKDFFLIIILIKTVHHIPARLRLLSPNCNFHLGQIKSYMGKRK